MEGGNVCKEGLGVLIRKAFDPADTWHRQATVCAGVGWGLSVCLTFPVCLMVLELQEDVWMVHTVETSLR